MDTLKNISIIFTSIFFESLPFLLLGAFISSVIETYVSDETMAKIIPKNKVFGSFVGIFLGLFLPACDCAVIPVSKRLLKKKVPINVAVSFMLASPIINPVVLLSTYYAFFKTNPEVFWYRLLFGIIIALVIGIIMGIIYNNKRLIKNELLEDDDDDDCCACECGEHHHHEHHKHTLKGDFLSIIKHTANDMFEVVKYLMFGAFIASLVQVMLPRSVMNVFNDNQVLSILVLMIFAYLISLCSTSDSFVGKSLLQSFSKGSVMAYLLLGPMIDVKNTFVLLGNYKKSFVITLISLIFIVTFICSWIVVMFI